MSAGERDPAEGPTEPAPTTPSPDAPDPTQPAPIPDEDTDADADETVPAPVSKNQRKKFQKRKAWEDGREDRKRRRKEKRHAKVLRRRELVDQAAAEGIDPQAVLPKKAPRGIGVPVPVSIILDCGFESYMHDEEQMSLSAQLVRCYSHIRRGGHRAHLLVSSFGGKLRERFDGTLCRQHENWIGVRFVEGDYRSAAREAEALMRGDGGGEMIDLLRPREDEGTRTPENDTTIAESESEEHGSVVYLTSDSPHTLTRLQPHTSYVIGGLVDRNREKGLCYRRAREHGVRTAKLPIGEYMALSTRHVLTTNQVVDIITKWLDCGDWGSAFVSTIPSRKRGVLKNVISASEDQNDGDHEGGDEGLRDGDQAIEADREDGSQENEADREGGRLSGK